MKFYMILILTLLVSCKPKQLESNDREIEKKIPINNKVDTTYTKNTSTIKLENDTTIIYFKNLNLKILDIRYNTLNKRALLLLNANKLISKINLPTQDDYSGFSVNWVKEIENGFEISIEYGSRYYHEKKFEFSYKNNSYYLTQIYTEAFDKFNTSKNAELKKSLEKVNPPLHIDKFKLDEFITSIYD